MLSRSSSSSNSTNGAITTALIKGVTQRFDVEIVFKLSLNSKGILSITNLERCVSLVELSLSDNNISKIQGLDALLNLKRLNLSSNKIAKLENIWHLEKLEVLLLQNNELPNFESLSLPQFTNLRSLKSLYLQNLDHSQSNPVCSAPSYKSKLLAAVPSLWSLDGERACSSINYAELSQEMSNLINDPPPPKEVVLPPVPAWLDEGLNSTAVPSSGNQDLAFAEVEAHSAALVAKLDECKMLGLVLAEEITRMQHQVAAEAGH